MDEPHIKPLLFVVMPFGQKKDPSHRTTIDFDRVYDEVLRPVAESVDVEIIRADEETTGGIIHQAMYERLLLAEIVVADLTLLNANVFYELGVRHAARPRSTILMYARVSQLPFDVAPTRAIPYELSRGKLSDGETKRLREVLEPRLRDARESEDHDSPLFQLISDYPGIELAHEVTEAFRDRVRVITGMTTTLRSLRHRTDRDAGLEELKRIEQRIDALKAAPPELLIDLLLAYRDYEAWEEMIRWVGMMPAEFQNHPTMQQQLALAYNRRNEEGDRTTAISILKELIDEHGSSAETRALLGRVYKDEWQSHRDSDSGVGRAALDEAIHHYGEGFAADPRDYYPGINFLTLLLVRGTDGDLEYFDEIAPAVSFAVGRLGGTDSDDYWQVATVVELAALREDEKLAVAALGRALLLRPVQWERATTARNLRLVAETRPDSGAWIADLARRLDAGADS